MPRMPMIFSALWIPGLLLFGLGIVGKTSVLGVEYGEFEFDEDSTATTENAIWSEETTETYMSSLDTIVMDGGTSARWNQKNESNNSATDIVLLNVGGRWMATFRSTLTVVPTSGLANLFHRAAGGPKKTHFFFDYNPVLFEILLDQLRALKRRAPIAAYELEFVAPYAEVEPDFANMVSELGLSPDRFLSPLVGTHLNVSVNSLVGWKECFRGKYSTPFDASVLTKVCKGKRLLVACRSTTNKKSLTVAGVGKREDIFHPCSPNIHCSTIPVNETGFYYVQDHAWGFEGRPKDLAEVTNVYQYQYHLGYEQPSTYMNPCDTSDQHAAYRLCWSLRSNVGRGGGDRCGASKNLHNTKGWERLIYQPI